MSLAGSFLVARSSLRDPNFSRTVVFLMAHNEDGAFGLVVNRAATAAGLPWPLFVGGPCPSPGLLMLHGQPDWAAHEPPAEDDEEKPELAPGIFAGDAGTLKQASEPGAAKRFRFRVFTGYAGWGEGQLEGEIAAGAWAVLPATGELLFDTPADELWERLAPPRIPLPSVN